MTDLEEQSLPDGVKCPECGEEATEESIIDHRLSTLGYLHDDQLLECSDCENSWWHGVPIGSKNKNSDLYCDSCESCYMLPHRVQVMNETRIQLHLKCPNCYYFKRINRTAWGKNRIYEFEYPQVTGE